jgi:lipoprotein-releasing system permease protein
MPALDEDLDPEVRAVIDNAPPLRPAVIVGRELAKTLHIYVGDEVTIVSPLGELSPVGLLPRTKRMRVAAVFYTGMYEYDASHVYMLMDEAREFFQLGERTAAIDIKVRDGEKVDGFAERIGAAIERDDLRVRDWREINRNLFSALKLERFATFVILSLAIAVASFCILCTLLLMVTEKSKDIAILKSLGASDIAVLRTFVAEGLLIGGMGTLFGITTGLALCAGLSWFGLRLDPDVYYIDRLPIAVSATDFLAVCGSAIVICMVATLLPAFAASRVRPVEGLRYE